MIGIQSTCRVTDPSQPVVRKGPRGRDPKAPPANICVFGGHRPTGTSVTAWSRSTKEARCGENCRVRDNDNQPPLGTHGQRRLYWALPLAVALGIAGVLVATSAQQYPPLVESGRIVPGHPRGDLLITAIFAWVGALTLVAWSVYLRVARRGTPLVAFGVAAVLAVVIVIPIALATGIWF
jgi:hypothetical protein